MGGDDRPEGPTAPAAVATGAAGLGEKPAPLGRRTAALVLDVIDNRA